MPHRVYIRELDLMLKPDEARLLLESTTRARSMFGCHDRHCCPRTVQECLRTRLDTFSFSV
ncbi:MAG: hypothetical protein ACREJ5_22660 [Geminicoccaceae bacterium]